MDDIRTSRFINVGVSGLERLIGIFWPTTFRTKESKRVGVFDVIGFIENQGAGVGQVRESDNACQSGDCQGRNCSKVRVLRNPREQFC